MDNQLRQSIIREVREAMRESLEQSEERWVNAEQLANQFSCFSMDWIRRHGHELPRTCAAYSNRWCYPLHKINRLMMEGKINHLDVCPVIK